MGAGGAGSPFGRGYALGASGWVACSSCPKVRLGLGRDGELSVGGGGRHLVAMGAGDSVAVEAGAASVAPGLERGRRGGGGGRGRLQSAGTPGPVTP